MNTAPGNGTEFVIKVWFEHQEGSEEKPVNQQEEKKERSLAVDFSTKRLLLVEDMAINREIATMLLKNLGFALETAENGQEAVDKVAASTPGYFDAVLMDIQMPVMNGYDATSAIRALSDPVLKEIPIVAMTANAFSEDVKKAQDVGMNGYIAKPIDVNNMVSVLQEILGNH